MSSSESRVLSLPIGRYEVAMPGAATLTMRRKTKDVCSHHLLLT